MGAIKHPRGEHPFHLQPSVPPPGTGAPRAKKLFQPLHFGLGEEAEQQPLCYAKFPTEAMLGLALRVPSGMPEPPTIISSKGRNLPGYSAPANNEPAARRGWCQLWGRTVLSLLPPQLCSPHAPVCLLFAFLPSKPPRRGRGRRWGLQPALTQLVVAPVGAAAETQPSGTSPGVGARGATPQQGCPVLLTGSPPSPCPLPLGKGREAAVGFLGCQQTRRVLQAHGKRVGKDTGPR